MERRVNMGAPNPFRRVVAGAVRPHGPLAGRAFMPIQPNHRFEEEDSYSEEEDSVDSEESVDFSDDEIFEEENGYNEEVKQRLLQDLEAGLKIAYAKLRNNTLDNRFNFPKVVQNYMKKTIAPNLYLDTIKTVMDCALTAENGFLAVLLLSWFKEENTPDLVCQLFVSQMKAIVGNRKNESQLLTEQLNFYCYKKKGRAPGRDFGIPPRCFRDIVANVRRNILSFECGICADEKPVAELVKCEPLSGEDKGNEHKFCIDCVKGYGAASVSQPNVTPGGEGLRCMQQGCKGFLKHAVVISCIPKDQKQMRRVLEKRLSTAAILASQIPSEECQFCSFVVVFEEPPEVDKIFNCMKCKAKFCRICKKMWGIHIGKKCQDVADRREMTAEERAQVKLAEELSKLSIRYCQRCNIAFLKEEGCNHMTCRCGREQCYLCNVPVKGYDHFCRHTTNPKPGVCPQKCGKACMLWADPKAQEVEARKKLIDSYKGRISGDKLRRFY